MYLLFIIRLNMETDTALPMNERIRLLMTKLDVGQTKLAGIIGCTPQAIGCIVRNENKPGIDIITGILVSLPEVSPDWLLLGRGEMKKSDVPVYNSGEVLRKTDDPEVKIFSCKDCIEKEKRIDELTSSVKRAEYTIGIQDKLIVEYETQLGKNVKVS